MSKSGSESVSVEGFGKGTKIIKRSTDKFNGLHEPYYT